MKFAALLSASMIALSVPVIAQSEEGWRKTGTNIVVTPAYGEEARLEFQDYGDGLIRVTKSDTAPRVPESLRVIVAQVKPGFPVTKAHGAVAPALPATVRLASSVQASAPRAKDGSTFHWSSSPPLILPKPDAKHQIVAVKDPSIVHAEGKFHVFMTIAGPQGWGLAYTSFRTWREAGSAPLTFLDRSAIGPGYRAAPQVFYFAPQKRWYMIFQGGDPLYSTTTTIDDPLSWSAPTPFFTTAPDVVKDKDGRAIWLDFWVICDDSRCYLFNTVDNGRLYRSNTSLADFPRGFGNT